MIWHPRDLVSRARGVPSFIDRNAASNARRFLEACVELWIRNKHGHPLAADAVCFIRCASHGLLSLLLIASILWRALTVMLSLEANVTGASLTVTADELHLAMAGFG